MAYAVNPHKRRILLMLLVYVAHSRAFAFRLFCFPIARNPTTAAMKTMMAMIFMILSYVYHPFWWFIECIIVFAVQNY